MKKIFTISAVFMLALGYAQNTATDIFATKNIDRKEITANLFTEYQNADNMLKEQSMYKICVNYLVAAAEQKRAGNADGVLYNASQAIKMADSAALSFQNDSFLIISAIANKMMADSVAKEGRARYLDIAMKKFNAIPENLKSGTDYLAAQFVFAKTQAEKSAIVRKSKSLLPESRIDAERTLWGADIF